MANNTYPFFVTCAKGTEGPLRKELVRLKIRGAKGDSGGVSFLGTLSDAFKTCLHSRVGMRVLLQLGESRVVDADDLYEFAKAMPWLDFVARDTTIAVSATCRDNPNLRHTGFVALKTKDGIVDAVRDAKGWRPSVDPKNPTLPIVIHIVGDSARIYLDMAGEPLHRRGYRVAMVPAPLKESLAAAILNIAGIHPEHPFVDPMAGSGTLAIEHAMVARGIAPGSNRKFAFEGWISPEQTRIWRSFKQLSQDSQLPRAPGSILVRDVSPEAIAAARTNARAAGVEHDIVFQAGAIAGFSPQGPDGAILFNPPYGERISPVDHGSSDREMFEHIRDLWKRAEGWKFACLAATPALPQAIPQRPAISHRLWNGPIETRLLVYGS